MTDIDKETAILQKEWFVWGETPSTEKVTNEENTTDVTSENNDGTVETSDVSNSEDSETDTEKVKSTPLIRKNGSTYIVLVDERPVGTCTTTEDCKKVVEQVMNTLTCRNSQDYRLYTLNEKEGVYEMWGKNRFWLISYDALLHTVRYVSLPNYTSVDENETKED